MLGKAAPYKIIKETGRLIFIKVIEMICHGSLPEIIGFTRHP